jgi:hypothetical protein
MSFFICRSRSSTDGSALRGGGGGGGGARPGGGGGGEGGGSGLAARRVRSASLMPPLLLLLLLPPLLAESSMPRPISRNSTSSSPIDSPMSASSSTRLLYLPLPLLPLLPLLLPARFCARAAMRAASLSCCHEG